LVLFYVLGDCFKLIYGEKVEVYEFKLEKIFIGDFKLVLGFVLLNGIKSNALDV
jgi:hypothetical protein